MRFNGRMIAVPRIDCLSIDSIPLERSLPIHLPQDFHPLSMHLNRLMQKVREGAAGDAVVHELQQSLTMLNELATQDALTGALNRRGLIEKLNAELDRARRTGHPFSLAVIGIDRFHALNDQYGDGIGQQILRSLAQAALQLLRSLDSVGRINDDEFAIILPTTWLDQGGVAIARLTGGVSAVDWAGIAPDLTVTFSSGLTTNAHDDTSETMIARATAALMEAKEKGPGSIAQLEQALPDIDPDLL